MSPAPSDTPEPTGDRPDASTRISLPASYDLRRTLSGQRMAGDPTTRVTHRIYALARWTPDGAAALRLRQAGDSILAEAWGAGAPWLLGCAPDLLGLRDDPSGFRPPEGPVRRMWRRAPGLHLPRTPFLFERALQAVLQQLVAGPDAAARWRRLARRLGSAAPGPDGLRLPPRPEDVSGAAGPVFSACGIPLIRARTLRLLARDAHRLTAARSGGWPAVESILLRLKGVGPWTVGYLRGSAWGDPDAVIPGDDNLPDAVAWTLAGEARGTDARMLELLAPFEGHRYRVVRLIHATRSRAPRRGARRPLRLRPGRR